MELDQLLTRSIRPPVANEIILQVLFSLDVPVENLTSMRICLCTLSTTKSEKRKKTSDPSQKQTSYLREHRRD